MAGVVRVGRMGAGGVTTIRPLAGMRQIHVVAGVRRWRAGLVRSTPDVVGKGRSVGRIRRHMTGANRGRIGFIKAMRSPISEFRRVAKGFSRCPRLVGSALAGMASVMSRVSRSFLAGSIGMMLIIMHFSPNDPAPAINLLYIPSAPAHS